MALPLVTALTGAAALRWWKLLTMWPTNRHQLVIDLIDNDQASEKELDEFYRPKFLTAD